MDICLVIPPSPFLLDERVFPSLGILRVAASLESVRHRVDVLDLSGVSNYLEAVESYHGCHKVDAYGITATTPQYPSVVKIAKRLTHDSKVILGGPHVTLCAAAEKLEKKSGVIGRAQRAMGMMHDTFDVLVSGDGEIAIHKAIQHGAMGLVDGDDMKGGLFMSDEFYDQTPWPARHLIDMGSYRYLIEGKEATSLIAQLGCPFRMWFLRWPQLQSVTGYAN